jgi:hypothetical protein
MSLFGAMTAASWQTDTAVPSGGYLTALASSANYGTSSYPGVVEFPDHGVGVSSARVCCRGSGTALCTSGHGSVAFRGR